MIVEAIDKSLVFSGPILDVALCFTMFFKRRWSSYPALFLFVAIDLVASVVLYLASPTGTTPLYTRLYVGFDVLSFVLQLSILFEVARAVLKPAGVWIKEAFKPLVLTACFGALVALGASIFLHPNSVHGPESIQLRAEIFTGLLSCELVIAMMLSASEVGLPWRSHVMAIGQGLMLWSLIATTVEGTSAYIGTYSPYYQWLYYLRSVNYIVVVAYWTVSLWRNEPARRPISPALRKYVIALNERVQYDLGKAGH